MARVPSSITKLLPKPKKNTPPLTGGARDGGFFNAPESRQPEFQYVDPSTLPEFQRPTSPSSGFYVDEFSVEFARQDARRLARDYATNRSIQRLKQIWDEGTEAAERRKRRGYRIPALFAPYQPARPVLDVPVTPVTGQPPAGFYPPGTTLNEPDFGIPEDPPEDTEKKREEEFEDCEELTEKIRSLTGVEVPLCPRRGPVTDFSISSNEARQALHMVRSKRKSGSRRGGEHAIWLRKG